MIVDGSTIVGGGLSSLCCSRMLGRLGLQYHVSGMNAVAVFLPLPQLAANKSNGNHGTVGTHHFVFGGALYKTEDSYFAAGGLLKLSRVQKVRGVNVVYIST